MLTDASGQHTTSPANAAGSMSADRAGLHGVIEANMNTAVVLKSDDLLINALKTSGRLDDKNSAYYQKILLYFDLGGYRFYLNDPFPGKIIMSAGVRRSPADAIIQKWDFTQTANPSKLQ